MTDRIHVLEAYRPTDPPLTNGTDNRSGAHYVAVAKQFEVATNPRYTANRQGKNETYCNIFVWDVTRAMCCEVPHWVDANGQAVGVGKGHELNANAVCDWLAGEGTSHCGWTTLTAADAAKRATEGRPMVVVWKNPGGVGHVAMVLPSTEPLHIAQAGASNFFDKSLATGFGTRIVTFFMHA